jgi:hypothetical protein
MFLAAIINVVSTFVLWYYLASLASKVDPQMTTYILFAYIIGQITKAIMLSKEKKS